MSLALPPSSSALIGPGVLLVGLRSLSHPFLSALTPIQTTLLCISIFVRTMHLFPIPICKSILSFPAPAMPALLCSEAICLSGGTFMLKTFSSSCPNISIQAAPCNQGLGHFGLSVMGSQLDGMREKAGTEGGTLASGRAESRGRHVMGVRLEGHAGVQPLKAHPLLRELPAERWLFPDTSDSGHMPSKSL